VVVDTGSDDGGSELAAGAGAQVISRPDNPGFGEACNAGLEHAAAEVTVLLNPDVELLDDGLATLAERARGREALLAPGLLEPDGSIQRTAHPLPGRARELLPALAHPPLLPLGPRLRAEPWRARERRTVGWAIAACLTARTDLLRRLGPFDPRAFLFYEDLDLCLRARAAGIATELHPDIVLRHAGAHSTERAFAGEPFALLARRRREVVGERLGRRALLLDDLAQALTFATRSAARAALGRDASRPRAQLHALEQARKNPTAPPAPK
jgi:GT2 family glycosyltransferase